MIKLDKSICNDLKAAMSREWLETNGIGGFASGTVSGAGTRRYHGLLTAATRPPLGRIRTASKLEEKLTIDGQSFELSVPLQPELSTGSNGCTAQGAIPFRAMSRWAPPRGRGAFVPAEEVAWPG